MRYVCRSCFREHAIDEGTSWPLETSFPLSCECGGTLFKESVSLTYASTRTFDPVSAANSILRQPGSPNIHSPI